MFIRRSTLLMNVLVLAFGATSAVATPVGGSGLFNIEPLDSRSFRATTPDRAVEISNLIKEPDGTISFDVSEGSQTARVSINPTQSFQEIARQMKIVADFMYNETDIATSESLSLQITGTTPIKPSSSDPENPQPSPTTKKSKLWCLGGGATSVAIAVGGFYYLIQQGLRGSMRGIYIGAFVASEGVIAAILVGYFSCR